MSVLLRLPYLAAVFLVAVPCAGAETPFTDPVPPAVVGRPLFWFQSRTPEPAVRPKPLATRAPKSPQAASRPVASKPHPPKKQVTAGKAAPAPSTPRVTAATSPPATRVAAVPATAVLGNGDALRAAKPAVDDRADPRARAGNEVGKGTHFARKPLDPGAYISSKYQVLVREYYDAHPAPGQGGKWRIGEPVPRKAKLAGIPDDLLTRLPKVPPGHQYAQVDGEVVLLAAQSRMVVDGVPRSAR